RARLARGIAAGGGAVSEERLREQLRELRAPGEQEAQERGWRVVRAAFEQHVDERARVPMRRARLLIVVAAVLTLVVAAFTPPDGVRLGYRSGGALRLVAGDGTGDRLLLRSVAPAAAAWRPGKGHVLAVSDWAGRVLMLDADSGGLLWRSTEATIPTELSWSADGRRLLALSPRSARLFDAGGRSLTTISTPVGARAEAAAFVPGRHEFALLQHERPADRSHVDLVRADSGRRPSQRLFA